MRRLPKTHKKLPMKKEDEPDFFELDKRSPLPPLGETKIPNTAPVGQGLLGASNQMGFFSGMSAFDQRDHPLMGMMGQQHQLSAQAPLSAMSNGMGMNGMSSMNSMGGLNGLLGSMNATGMGSMNGMDGLGPMNSGGNNGFGSVGGGMGSMNGLSGLGGMNQMNSMTSNGMNALRESSGFVSSAILNTPSDFELQQRLRQLQQMELLERQIPDANNSAGGMSNFGFDLNPVPMNLMMGRQPC